MIKGGPKIIKDGLVLCLDAHDAKSYAGEPTTNLLGSNDNPLNGMSGVTFSKVETQSDGWIKYSMNGTFTGGTYPYICVIDSVSFTGGTAYTSRAMIKTNVESKFNYFGTTGINYVNQPKDAEGTSRSVVTEENGLNVYTVSREGFIYTSTTTQGGYLFTNPINNTTFSSSTDFVWIKNVQVEQKTYPTPWTYTSRSATDGWVDRTTNNNDGTLTNMIGTGASHYRDGQVIMPVSASYLDFDATDDRVAIGSIGSMTAFTVELWINPDAVQDHQNPIDCNYSYNGTTGNIGPRLELRTGTSPNWIISGDTGNNNNYHYLNARSSAPSAGSWYQAVLTYDGSGNTSGLKSYWDGSLVTTGAGTVNSPSAVWVNTMNNVQLGLGFHLGSNRHFNGQISITRIYNKALTAAQILSNYNATKGRFL